MLGDDAVLGKYSSSTFELLTEQLGENSSKDTRYTLNLHDRWFSRVSQFCSSRKRLSPRVRLRGLLKPFIKITSLFARDR